MVQKLLVAMVDDAAAIFAAGKTAASESATGVVELATTAEATTGTDTARAVTPAGVAAAVAALGAIIPAGTVISYAGATAPAGWLKCNGAVVSRSTYAALFAAIGTTYGAGDGSTTFKLPELRGEFIRGLDDGRGTDSGRALGSFQNHQFEDHVHNVATTGDAAPGTGRNRIYASGTSDQYTGIAYTGNRGTETRPRNIALLLCIKT